MPITYRHEVPADITGSLGIQAGRAKGLDALRLALKDFFNQVVQDVSVTACEGPDETGDVLLPLH